MLNILLFCIYARAVKRKLRGSHGESVFFPIPIYSINPSLCTGTLDVEHVKIVDTI